MEKYDTEFLTYIDITQVYSNRNIYRDFIRFDVKIV